MFKLQIAVGLLVAAGIVSLGLTRIERRDRGHRLAYVDRARSAAPG